MGRGPPPHLSSAASDEQDSLSPTPPARPGAGARWALGVGGHGCVPAAVASRPRGPWGQPGSRPRPTVGQLRRHRANTSCLWGNAACLGTPQLSPGPPGKWREEGRGKLRIRKKELKWIIRKIACQMSKKTNQFSDCHLAWQQSVSLHLSNVYEKFSFYVEECVKNMLRR